MLQALLLLWPEANPLRDGLGWSCWSALKELTLLLTCRYLSQGVLGNFIATYDMYNEQGAPGARQVRGGKERSMIC